jgi:hypothetical protein
MPAAALVGQTRKIAYARTWRDRERERPIFGPIAALLVAAVCFSGSAPDEVERAMVPPLPSPLLHFVEEREKILFLVYPGWRRRDLLTRG